MNRPCNRCNETSHSAEQCYKSGRCERCSKSKQICTSHGTAAHRPGFEKQNHNPPERRRGLEYHQTDSMTDYGILGMYEDVAEAAAAAAAGTTVPANQEENDGTVPPFEIDEIGLKRKHLDESLSDLRRGDETFSGSNSSPVPSKIPKTGLSEENVVESSVDDSHGVEEVRANSRHYATTREGHVHEENFSCVNLKLKGMLQKGFKSNESLGIAFLEVIDRFVFNWNKIAFEASLFSNFHVGRLLREGKDIPEIDQRLIEASCRAVTDTSHESKDEEIRVSIAQFMAFRPVVVVNKEKDEVGNYELPLDRHFGSIICNIRRQMLTNAVNHIVCPFMGRLINHVGSRFSLSHAAARKFIAPLFSENAVLNDDQRTIKAWLVFNPHFDNIVKANSRHFLRLMYEMLQHQESLDPMTRGKKTFSLLPVFGSYIMSHVHLDRTSLREVLQWLSKEHRRAIGFKLKKLYEDNNLSKAALELLNASLTRPTFNFSQKMFHDLELSKNIWGLIFNYKSLETKNRKFDFGISTNGYDVSFRFVKPKQAAESSEVPKAETFVRIVAIDPGKINIGTSFWTNNVREDPRRAQVTTAEYRHESKFGKSQKWQQNVREGSSIYASNIENMPTMKTTNVETSIRYRLSIGDWMFYFCKKKPFLKWRFKTKVFSQKAMVNVVKRLIGETNEVGKKKERVLVGLGDWSAQDGFKGRPKAPVKKLRAALKKRATVIDIDEYRTSKTCSVCCEERDMKHVKVWKGVEDAEGIVHDRLVDCYGIVRCLKTRCMVTWQRDHNAARNIHALLWGILNGKERPPAMTRKIRNQEN